MPPIKIKIPITTETKTETEIEIGSYYKNICFFWKVLSETRSIVVYKSDFTDKCQIEIVDTENIFRPSVGAVPCEESEFNTAFLEISTRLSNLAGINPIQELFSAMNKIL
jgi:hypothetical protein